jgi:hypothetical protein
MHLDEFIENVYRNPPETLEASDVARVSPNPWIWRTGSGKDARIRMRLGDGKLRYWRRQGESVWHRVEWTPEFDIGSHDLLG